MEDGCKGDDSAINWRVQTSSLVQNILVVSIVFGELTYLASARMVEGIFYAGDKFQNRQIYQRLGDYIQVPGAKPGIKSSIRLWLGGSKTGTQKPIFGAPPFFNIAGNAEIQIAETAEMRTPNQSASCQPIILVKGLGVYEFGATIFNRPPFSNKNHGLLTHKMTHLPGWMRLFSELSRRRVSSLGQWGVEE
uniref:Uncharacterized protein n=1 Tax=Coccidioides posadasii RMSCC 3488 TaxID=454284 RepID=A0A0J6FLL1_COCPO|nr:hypothetical protein CPAG_06073 [Coccidioides posadasii RMSCC 3488]